MDTSRHENTVERMNRRFPDIEALLASDQLNEDEKERILRQWELDARALDVAEDENMRGRDRSQLARIHAALAGLGISAAATTTP
jgi:hypothetical protein